MRWTRVDLVWTELLNVSCTSLAQVRHIGACVREHVQTGNGRNLDFVLELIDEEVLNKELDKDFEEFVEKVRYTAWKVSKYGVFSGSYFLALGLNTEIFSVNLRIQAKYSKKRTSKNSVLGHFSRSEIQLVLWSVFVFFEYGEGITQHFGERIWR